MPPKNTLFNFKHLVSPLGMAFKFFQNFENMQIGSIIFIFSN